MALEYLPSDPIEDRINKVIKKNKDNIDTNLISDTYHTFGELYEHRIQLWIALCKYIDYQMSVPGDHEVWRSKKHSDGSEHEGWFLLGARKWEGGQITYHLPMNKWEETNFAETLDQAPEFDGHTSADVLERIKNLII